MKSMCAFGYICRMALPTSPGPQQRSNTRIGLLRENGITDAISSRSFGFDVPCSAHHSFSNSSMWGWMRASISLWLMGGDCMGRLLLTTGPLYLNERRPYWKFLIAPFSGETTHCAEMQRGYRLQTHGT